MKRIADLKDNELQNLLRRFGIDIKGVADKDDIPGSYWGPPEAGIIQNALYVRNDTPVHSALHESCHYICMDSARRATLHTDTGGDYDEENAVCFLQIVLSSYLTGIDLQQACNDMDEWGYTFRLGSAQKWFENDAEDAFNWLMDKQLILKNKTPTWQLRR